MGNEIAPEGQVYVCLACGKRSRDKYGNEAINRGWDISCVMNSKLVDENQVVLGEDERVERIRENE